MNARNATVFAKYGKITTQSTTQITTLSTTLKLTKTIRPCGVYQISIITICFEISISQWFVSDKSIYH